MLEEKEKGVFVGCRGDVDPVTLQVISVPPRKGTFIMPSSEKVERALGPLLHDRYGRDILLPQMIPHCGNALSANGFVVMTVCAFYSLCNAIGGRPGDLVFAICLDYFPNLAAELIPDEAIRKEAISILATVLAGSGGTQARAAFGVPPNRLDEYPFPVYGTQGGGIARYREGSGYTHLEWVEVPRHFPDFKVGDLVPEEWGTTPANQLAQQAG